MELVSMREFARRKNVNLSTIQKAIKRGRIEADEETGKIAFEKQSQNWENNRDISKLRNLEIIEPDLATKFMQAKTNKEIYTAKLKELEYNRLSEKLVDKAEVEKEIFKFCRILRDNILAIPNRASVKFTVQTLNYIKPLMVEHCGEDATKKTMQAIELKILERLTYQIWEKESREVFENLGQTSLSSRD